MSDAATKFSYRNEPELMARLAKAQNSAALADTDVMTWAGMCDSAAELERHVLTCEDRVARFIPPVRRNRARRAA